MSDYHGAQEISLYKTIDRRRKAKDTPPYTRLFFACLLKEGSTVDGEKDLRAWIEEKRNQLSMKMGEMQRDNHEEYADIDLTGFTLINGPVLITLLESRVD
jgi:hypothetical protein